jgi:DNA polymerase III alpha subunit
MLITQFDLKSIEKMGLVKIDLLGTRGLTVLGDVAEKVFHWNRREYEDPLGVLDSIPKDDPDTAELVQTAQTIGCFQIESPGMRATLREIDAASQEDLMIALALYRPGPMTGGLKSSFVKRHLGQEPVEHLHPALASLLKDTYGVILYQEQVLLIASRIAGLSMADADLLRRAMSHFDPGDRMKTLKKRFVKGAGEKSGIPPDTAENIWELMAAFAGYGFPKAHAASYAQISWRSAWCKAHYPAEFIAAVLAGWGGYYRQRVYLTEARRMGLSVHPPHINHAFSQFTVAYPEGLPRLYMGLNQVRELTKRTQAHIMRNRPFLSMEDFLIRVDPRPNEVENLVKVGALSGFGSIPDLLRRIEQRGWSYGQPPLLAVDFKTNQPDWDLRKRAEAQYAILGVSLDAHPLELLSNPLTDLGIVSSLEALIHPDEELIVAGIKLTTQRFYAHEGEPFYILELEDMEGVLPVMMSPSFYRQNRNLISSTVPFAVQGIIAELPTTGEPVLRANKIDTIVE